MQLNLLGQMALPFDVPSPCRYAHEVNTEQPMPNPNVIATFRDVEGGLLATVSRVMPCPATAMRPIELRLDDTEHRELVGITYFDDAGEALAYARVCAGEPPL